MCDYLDNIKDGTIYRIFKNHNGTLDEWDAKVAKILEEIKQKSVNGKAGRKHTNK